MNHIYSKQARAIHAHLAFRRLEEKVLSLYPEWLEVPQGRLISTDDNISLSVDYAVQIAHAESGSRGVLLVNEMLDTSPRGKILMLTDV